MTWDTSTYLAGIQSLRDHADGLIEAPTRLHDRAIGDKDAFGAPRFSAAFWSILVGGPFATVSVEENRACSLPHPLDAVVPCERCNGAYSYPVERLMYRHPLAAALERLRPAPPTSSTWPSPYRMILALLRCDGDLRFAAEIIGRPIHSDDERKVVEAAFLLALRKLAGRWSSGPIAKPTPYIELSESQQRAQDAA